MNSASTIVRRQEMPTSTSTPMPTTAPFSTMVRKDEEGSDGLERLRHYRQLYRETHSDGREMARTEPPTKPKILHHNNEVVSANENDSVAVVIDKDDPSLIEAKGEIAMMEPQSDNSSSNNLQTKTMKGTTTSVTSFSESLSSSTFDDQVKYSGASLFAASSLEHNNSLTAGMVSPGVMTTMATAPVGLSTAQPIPSASPSPSPFHGQLNQQRSPHKPLTGFRSNDDTVRLPVWQRDRRFDDYGLFTSDTSASDDSWEANAAKHASLFDSANFYSGNGTSNTTSTNSSSGDEGDDEYDEPVAVSSEDSFFLSNTEALPKFAWKGAPPLQLSRFHDDSSTFDSPRQRSRPKRRSSRRGKRSPNRHNETLFQWLYRCMPSFPDLDATCG